MKLKALFAMSGGVDSSAAAALAAEQGIHGAGVTLKLHGAETQADIEDARTAAERLGFEHYVFDFSKEFDRNVIRRFVETYEGGETPNPCIECNRCIKFNLQLLKQFDCDLFVTGHYARIKQDAANGRYLLLKAVDEKKDQSYVLYRLTQQQLERACFPLGGLSKNEVRKIAAERKLDNAAKSESQDICFVPDGDYGSFIERYTGKKYPRGNIIDIEGKIIGAHSGIIRYTIGQRRGLGVAANVPVYVTAKSAADNTVTLGTDDALYSKTLTAKDINLIACTDLKKPMRVMVKTRYLQTAQNANAEQTGENTLHIEFDIPQRAITPGQAAVMYDGDIVVGGGTII